MNRRPKADTGRGITSVLGTAIKLESTLCAAPYQQWNKSAIRS